MAGIIIDAKVEGGPAFYLSRETQNMTFDLDGIVSGSGNFSRFTDIKSIAGIKSNERSSAARGGKLSLDEKQRLQTIEGPVSIQIMLKSSTEDISIPDPVDVGNFIGVKESAAINIDESWPSGYANYKKISYNGPILRNREFYDNNGDILTSSIDSWKLDKESLYRTNLNKTIIDAYIYPTAISVSTKMNRSTLYALNMNSLGSLTHLGIARMESSETPLKGITPRKPDIFISEDYSGQHTIKLKLSLNDNIIRKREEDNYLPCCFVGYSDMQKTDRIGLSSESIFNCSCADLSPVS